LDLEETYEILGEFKQPFIALASQGDGQNEYSVVTEPWSFDRLIAIMNRNDAQMAERSNEEVVGQ